MPNTRLTEALTRRQRVADLWTRGVSIAGIARAVGCDWQTAQRDVKLLGKQAAGDCDLDRERHRLLAGAKAVEQAAWQAHAQATGADRLAALVQVRGAQAQALSVLGELAGADIERRLSALEEQAAAGGPTPIRGGAS